MSIEKRINPKTGKVKYIGRVYIGTSKIGTPKLKSKSFDKMKEAQEFVSNLTNFHKNRADKNISDKVLLNAVFNAFITEKAHSLKDNTIKNYKQTYTKWIDDHIGHIKIGEFSHITIRRFFDKIRDKGASAYVQNYTHILLFEVFKFATDSLTKYIHQNPMIGIERPKLEYNPTDSIKFWTKKDAEKVLKSAIGSDYYLIITIMINTGIRVSEAAALTSSSFDFDRGVLNISSQLTNYAAKGNEQSFESARYVVNQTKNKAGRSVPLNKKSIEAAKLLIAKNEGNYFLFEPESKSKKHEIILKRGRDSQIVRASILTAKTLGNAIKRFCDLSGVEYIGPHGLRHTFAANFLMNGGDIFTLSRILGHKNINSTQIYSHLTSNYLKSAMNIVEFGG